VALRLNVIGCGRAARVIARLLRESGRVEPGEVINRSLGSARAAVRFIGGGTPARGIDDAQPSGLWLVGTPDDAIAATAGLLRNGGRLRRGDIVFHLSGATPAEALAPCREAGALIASVHPVKNFSDPAVAAMTFRGTWCGVEGDLRALRRLGPLFRALGARAFRIASSGKPLYHGGGAFACNFLPVLIELALACEARAGVSRTTALAMFEPIVRETIDAIFRQGVGPALAGPISRGDAGSVQRHLDAMQAWRPEVAATYRALARTAVDIVDALSRVDRDRLQATRAVIERGATSLEPTPGTARPAARSKPRTRPDSRPPVVGARARRAS